MKLHKKELYVRGQALVIVLIVLVVGVIIAMAIVSRSQKNQLKVVEEKKSAEAIQVSDSLVNVSQSLNIEEIRAACASNFNATPSTECCIQSSALGGKFTLLGQTFDYPKCSEQAGGEANSDVKLCFKLESNFDSYQISKDQVLSIPFLSGSTAGACSMNIKATSSGSSNTGLYISKYYADKDANGNVNSFKPYSGDDTSEWLIGTSNSDWQSWKNTYVVSGNGIDIPISPIAGTPTYKIHEVRVRAVGNPVTVQVSPNPAGCVTDTVAMRITASANCGSSYRSVWYYRPIRESANAFFDYVLFNGSGDLKYLEN